MAGYTYATFVTALEVETNIPLTGVDANAGFVAILPTIIDQAEQQIYRELDLLATIVRDTSGMTTANTRNFTLPSALGRFVVLESINIISNDQRYPLTKISREVMDNIWPSDAGNGSLPAKWAPVTDQIIMFGPAPSAVLTVECIGTIRPTPLSASNTTTFLSQYLPDLFLAAAMVNASGYMRDYGAQADDPKFATSWGQRYAELLPSAKNEEMRRKFQGFVGGA